MNQSERSYLQQDKSTANIRNEHIFGSVFAVQPITDPHDFLPKYQQNMKYVPTVNQQCLSCCGRCCMVCVLPFGCCGCNNCSCFHIQPTAQGLVQQFGKFSRLLKPGFNMINPCSQTVQMVDLRLRVMNVGRHQTITKDNVKVSIQASVSFRITNPVVSHYVLGLNLNRALIQSTVASLRDVIGQYNLDDMLIQRLMIAEKAKKLVIKGIPSGIQVQHYPIQVQNIFIDETVIPPQIMRDLTSAARQKRLSQATIIGNKADVQSADLMRQSAQLMATKAAMQIRYLQMVTQLGHQGILLIMDIGIDKKGFK